MSDEVLTIDEAAAVLKVSPDIVGGLLDDGELPGRQIGGEWRTTKRALISYVDCVPLQMACCCPPVEGSAGASGQMAAANCCTPGDGACC